ncbi:hypothetical protein ABZX65_10090 [Streptomyces sp. NPDC003300]|uniref:hypothetical protein n=1 Tax=unclassified Streptomyces TaxID=2593676 RepID=UPI0033AABAEB
MTMAEWACRGLMGLGPTTHAESAVPPGATEEWKKQKSLPDLFGAHPVTSELWLVEAKGGRRLPVSARKKGARQLAVEAVLPSPYRKILCGTSLERRLFMMIDIEKDLRADAAAAAAVPSSSVDEADEEALRRDDDVLLDLARSRLLTYLALSSLPRAALRLAPVGAGSGRRSTAAAGLVRLLERDSGTAELRRQLGPDAMTEAGIRRHEGVDMLIARLPGSDLMLGLSRRLYGACRAIAEEERALVRRTQEKFPELRTIEGLRPGRSEIALSDSLYERRVRDRSEYLTMARNRERSRLGQAARRGFADGEETSWLQLTDVSPRLVLPDANGYLEAATPDTYLAVERESIDEQTA